MQPLPQKTCRVRQVRHPNKHINAAIEFAFKQGWIARPGHHAFCVIYCPAGKRGACQMSVWSTPKNPQAHAKDIIRTVENCRCE